MPTIFILVLLTKLKIQNIKNEIMRNYIIKATSTWMIRNDGQTKAIRKHDYSTNER